MIHKITFKNFLSFADEQIIDLTVDGYAPDTEVYRKPLPDIRVSPILGVLGANAHGKTNLIVAMKQFIRFSLFSFGAKNPSFILNAQHSNHKDKPILASIEFSNESIVYVYQIKLLAGEVINESLVKRTGSPGRSPDLFKLDRSADGLKISGEWVADITGQCEEILKDAKGATLLSLLAIGIKKEIVLRTMSSLVFVEFCDGDAHSSQVSEFYINNDEIFTQVKEYILTLDLGIKEIEIKKYEKENNIIEYHPCFIHTGKDSKDFTIGASRESLGVNRIYSFLKDVFVALKVGGVVVCDELDRSLHPHLLERFLELFKSTDTNPKNAQLIFTTHEAYVLNLLDKEQIAFVQKEDNESIFYKLSDVKGVGVRDNYLNKYMAGTYGGVPNN